MLRISVKNQFFFTPQKLDFLNRTLDCQATLTSDSRYTVEKLFFIYLGISLVIFLISFARLMHKRCRELSLGNANSSPFINYQYRQMVQAGSSDDPRHQSATGRCNFIRMFPFLQKPIFLDFFKIVVEISVILALQGCISTTICMFVWATFDFWVVIYLISLTCFGRSTSEDRETCKLIRIYYLVYSFMAGVPCLFIFKVSSLMDVYPHENQMYLIYAEGILLPIFCVLIYILTDKRSVFYPALYLIAGSIGHICCLAFMMYTQMKCQAQGCRKDVPCWNLFYSNFISFLPISFSVWMWTIVFLNKAAREGETHRYLSEVTSAFIWSLLLTTYAVSLDIAGVNSFRSFISVWAIMDIVIIISSNAFMIFRLLKANKSARKSWTLEWITLNDITRKEDLTPNLVQRINSFEDRSTCAICWDNLHLDDKLVGVIIECGHLFHLNCIFKWLKKSGTCPICRVKADLSDDAIQSISFLELNKALACVKARSTRSSMRSRTSNISRKTSSILSRKENKKTDQFSDLSTKKSSGKSLDSSVCYLCDKPYDRNTKFTIVGYSPECGHFFHYLCIRHYTRLQHSCPSCDDKNNQNFTIEMVILDSLLSHEAYQ